MRSACRDARATSARRAAARPAGRCSTCGGGGRQALGRPGGGSRRGRRPISFLAADHAALAGRADDAILDAWIFGGGAMRRLRLERRAQVRPTGGMAGARRSRRGSARRCGASLSASLACDLPAQRGDDRTSRTTVLFVAGHGPARPLAPQADPGRHRIAQFLRRMAARPSHPLRARTDRAIRLLAHDRQQGADATRRRRTDRAARKAGSFVRGRIRNRRCSKSRTCAAEVEALGLYRYEMLRASAARPGRTATHRSEGAPLLRCVPSRRRAAAVLLEERLINLSAAPGRPTSPSPASPGAWLVERPWTRPSIGFARRAARRDGGALRSRKARLASSSSAAPGRGAGHACHADLSGRSARLVARFKPLKT